MVWKKGWKWVQEEDGVVREHVANIRLQSVQSLSGPRSTKLATSSRFSILRISGERRKWRKGRLCLQNTRKYIQLFTTLNRLILHNSQSSVWTDLQSIILSLEIPWNIFITWDIISLAWPLRNKGNIWCGKYISTNCRRKWHWSKETSMECRLF